MGPIPRWFESSRWCSISAVCSRRCTESIVNSRQTNEKIQSAMLAFIDKLDRYSHSMISNHIPIEWQYRPHQSIMRQYTNFVHSIHSIQYTNFVHSIQYTNFVHSLYIVFMPFEFICTILNALQHLCEYTPSRRFCTVQEEEEEEQTDIAYLCVQQLYTVFEYLTCAKVLCNGVHITSCLHRISRKHSMSSLYAIGYTAG